MNIPTRFYLVTRPYELREQVIYLAALLLDGMPARDCWADLHSWITERFEVESWPWEMPVWLEHSPAVAQALRYELAEALERSLIWKRDADPDIQREMDYWVRWLRDGQSVPALP